MRVRYCQVMLVGIKNTVVSRAEDVEVGRLPEPASPPRVLSDYRFGLFQAVTTVLRQ